MPHFYFHCCSVTGRIVDSEGTELRDSKEAFHRAVALAREAMAADARRGVFDLTCFVEIEDEQHDLLLTVSFLEAVTVSSRYAEQPVNIGSGELGRQEK